MHPKLWWKKLHIWIYDTYNPCQNITGYMYDPWQNMKREAQVNYKWIFRNFTFLCQPHNDFNSVIPNLHPNILCSFRSRWGKWVSWFSHCLIWYWKSGTSDGDIRLVNMGGYHKRLDMYQNGTWRFVWFRNSMI